MTLQVRLVHALGDRLIDLPGRTHESPLVIGRASDADVQVPSPSLSRRHSLLYQFEGQWYVVDAGGTPRTLVNGKAATEPTALRSGDVVTLGTDSAAAQLTIDPFGLMAEGAYDDIAQPVAAAMGGSMMPPPAARHPAPAAAPVQSWPAVPQPSATRLAHPGVALPQPGQVPPGGRMGVPPPPPGIGAYEEFPAESTDDWTAAGAGADPASTRFYVPKKNAMTPAMIAGMIFAAIFILGGASFWYYTRQEAEKKRFEQAQAVEDKQAADAKAKADAAKKAKKAPAENLFGGKAEDVTARENDAKKPKVAAADNTAAQDPGQQTQEWRDVEDAHAGFPPKDAIVKYGLYMKRFPTSPYVATVRKYTDEALDALWWERITELTKEHKDLADQIKEKNRDLAQSQDAEFKKTLMEEKAKIEEALQAVDAKLKELNYAGEDVPNLNDEALMAELRRARDPQKYDPWKARAEKYIKETNGQKPIW